MHKYTLCRKILIIMGLFGTNLVAATHKVSDVALVVGYATAKTQVQRVELSLAWHNDAYLLKKYSGLNGFWQFAWHNLYNKYKADNWLTGVSASAVLAVYPWHCSQITLPYIQVSLGLSFFSGSKIAYRWLGSALLFEEQLEIGCRLTSNFSMGYRLMHNSNAFLADKNHGINYHALVFRFIV